MNVAVSLESGLFRPEPPRNQPVLRSVSRLINPREFVGGMPVMEGTVNLMAAFDPEAEIYVVSRYPNTGDGLTFEAKSLDAALERAEEIVTDIFAAKGLATRGIAVLIDEYASPAIFEN